MLNRNSWPDNADAVAVQVDMDSLFTGLVFRIMHAYMTLFSYKNIVEVQRSITEKKTEYETKLKLQER